MKNFKFDVFLSYNSRDKAVVRTVAERLRSQGLRVWFDDWMIEPGDSILSEIEKGLNESRTMVLGLSPAALGSGWVSLEHSALAFRSSSDDRRIVPLILAPCKIPNTLGGYKSIDLRQGDSAFIDLVSFCRPQLQDVSESTDEQELERTRLYTSKRTATAKVVLIGSSGVGKSSLAHRLIADRFVPTYSTHAMQIWRLDLPGSKDASVEHEVRLWDLAGQEDYRLIHQLFLDEAALVLLVVDPQRDDPFADAGDWLNFLTTRTGQRTSWNTSRLLIFSRIDVGGLRISNAEIERFCEQHGFSGWLATSAKTGENCSDVLNGGEPSALKQLIGKSIPWNELPQTITPRLVAELKNTVLAIRTESDVRLIRFAELQQRLSMALPDESFDESEVRFAVALLFKQGLVIPLKFGDLVLLQPELLNGYAAAIIRAARAHPDEIGSVREADIYQPDFDFTDVDRLALRSDEELLLRVLVQTFLDHSLCIAEDTSQGRYLVFPSQLRREKPMPHEPDIFVSYTFSGDWQTIWATLLVRLWYSQEFRHRELWRNAAEFESPQGHRLGLKIDHSQGEGVATIDLYFDRAVPDDVKALFIEYVNRHLAKFGSEVSRIRRYACPHCGNFVRDLDAVRKRLDAEKDFIYCQFCDNRIPLIDFMEQRFQTDQVARKILAMDETATRLLDKQALEQILIGHLMAVCGEANQIFKPLTTSESGIDGEIEFKDEEGKASGKRIYVEVKSWNYFDSTRNAQGREIFYLKDEKNIERWLSEPVDLYLVARQEDEVTGSQTVSWMNLTQYLRTRDDKGSREIQFTGKRLDVLEVQKVRNQTLSTTT
jgi:small GTP-binding protein